MRKKILLAALAAATIVSAAAIFLSPTARGASLALGHQLRGRSIVYRLGCVMGPSSDPTEYRFEELLVQKYGLHCETTGGFAPSDDLLKFTSAYNAVTQRASRIRYGRGFLERTHAQAEKDVVTRNVVVKGCLAGGSRDLVLASGERFHLVPRFGEVEWPAANGEAETTPLIVTGRLTTVREGEWNRVIGPWLAATKIERDIAGSCGSASRRGA